MDKDEALKMCLEYIETDAHERKYVRHAIKQALAAQPAPVQEPVAWAVVGEGEWGEWVIGQQFETNNPPNHEYWKNRGYLLVPLYNTPPAAQRQWVGLTDEERDAIFELHHTRLGGWDHGGDEVMYDKHFEDAVAAIEAKLKEKNT